WEKIVLNLVSTAFKFTLEGSIELSLRMTDDAAVLRVSDTGIGISSEDLPKVFERFHRGQARGRTHEGTGIGLSLVEELVRLHEGSIEAESELGRGTTFTVRIPRGSAHLAPERVEAPLTLTSPPAMAAAYVEEARRWLPGGGEAVTEAAAEPSEPTGPRPLVLLADDNADMRAYVTRILRRHFDVEAVADGVEALVAAQRLRPDLVLTDIMMPNMDGMELLQRMRSDEALATVPVVMLSARAGEESLVEGIEAGADDYLVKPFSARELVARVRSQLELVRSRREQVELAGRERKALEELELQKRHLASIFMQAPAPVAILRGPSHVVELVNAPACDMLGRPREELIDRPLLEVAPELRGQAIVELMGRVLETGVPQIGREAPARIDRSGTGTPDELHLDFVYTPLLDLEGETVGVLAIGFDVTEQVAAREHMQGLRREAEAASRAKDEFLAMLGHELRNPLAPILTALELMRLRDADAFVKERAIIERQAEQLTTLVDDLLDVSRIARGKVELDRARVDLADVVAQALETVSPLLEHRRHHVRTDVPRGCFVHGDAARLGQVVSNLLSNAAKYTGPGGRIAVAATREGPETTLTVTDNGMGITPELLPQVFDLFSQGPRGIDRSQGGLGLGLSIVRNIAELHGGRVSVRSEGPGLGSTFTVTLPSTEAPEEVRSSAPAPSTRIRAPATRRRILVVDDNQDAAHTLAEYARELGHDVRVAFDGPRALEVAAGFQPDTAVLDLGLPGMSGYELAELLRECPGLESIRLLAVTGYGQASSREASERHGFEAHLVKPVAPSELAVRLEAGVPA
ncbi:MAG TPA: ATP-binding protein, partial [Longimicrobiales bacterium]|nr:ATP-binding protein [Longimicrobiales bacterium]